MTKCLIAALALITFVVHCNVAIALEDTPENRVEQAKRFIATVDLKALLQDTVQQVVASNTPETERTKAEVALFARIDGERLKQSVMTAAVITYSADELAALADFNGSPIGKSILSKQGAFVKLMAPQLEVLLKDAMQK